MIQVKFNKPFTIVVEWDGQGEIPVSAHLAFNNGTMQTTTIGTDKKGYFPFPNGVPAGTYPVDTWFVNEGGDGPHAQEVIESTKQKPSTGPNITVDPA